MKSPRKGKAQLYMDKTYFIGHSKEKYNFQAVWQNKMHKTYKSDNYSN